MHTTALTLVRDEPQTDEEAVPAAAVLAPARRTTSGDRSRLEEIGATTAEYATVTGCGVGFAAVLFKFLTSDGGQALLKFVFAAIRGLLPF